MTNTECSLESRKTVLVPVIAKDEVRTGTARARRKRSVSEPSRRFDRASIGFWLGGATFATVGCIVGYCMPYHRPVAIAISMIWWGIYIGCLGASLGALIGLFTRFAPARTENVGHSLSQQRSIEWSRRTVANENSRLVQQSGQSRRHILH